MTRRLPLHRTAGILALGLIAALGLSAQRSHSIPVGSRVRVWIPSRTVATLLRADGATFVLLPEGTSDTVSLSRDSVRGIEVSRPRRQWLIGAGLGAVTGSAAAMAIAAASCDPNDSSDDFACLFRVLFSPVVGAGVGGLLGAVVGGAIKTERWVPLEPDAVRVSVVRVPRGLGVGVSARF